MRKRQSVWLKQHWSNADINEDQKLDIGDVETLCRNLNISASRAAIRTNFEVDGFIGSICECFSNSSASIARRCAQKRIPRLYGLPTLCKIPASATGSGGTHAESLRIYGKCHSRGF